MTHAIITRRLLLGSLAATVLTPSFVQAQMEVLPLSDDDQDTVLDKISSYINSLSSLKGRFIQQAPTGQVDTGRFYLRRPGRMRFEYDDPNPLVIVSDGRWVMLNDRALETVDRYPLSSTPLKFILRKELNFREDENIVNVQKVGEDGVIITAREDEGEAQGELNLYFGESPIELRQWAVTDAQGYQTIVSFHDLVKDEKLNARLFVVEEEINPFDRKNR